jgi:hypothetical protein
VGETQWEALWANLFQPGVLTGVYGSTSLLPTANGSARSVFVAAGQALIGGHLFTSTASETLTIGANSTGSTRIDTVVVTLNGAADTMDLIVVPGITPNTAPTLPTSLTGTYQVRLADITVVNGATVINSGDVTLNADRWAYPWLTPLIPLARLADDARGIAATATIATAGNTFSLTGIPATWRGLRLHLYAKANTGSLETLLLRFNGDTGSNYHVIPGNSSAATSLGVGFVPASTGLGLWAIIEVPFYNHASISRVVSSEYLYVTNFAGVTNAHDRAGGVWNSTAAVTSIQLTCTSGFTVGSYVRMQGIV